MQISAGKVNEPYYVRAPMSRTLFGSCWETRKSNRELIYLSVKKETEDKFVGIYTTNFKVPLSRTISISVEDRIAHNAMSKSVQMIDRHY